MDFTTSYILVVTIVFLFLTLIWTRESMLNVSLKALFLVLGLSGLVLFLMQMGFVVKV